MTNIVDRKATLKELFEDDVLQELARDLSSLSGGYVGIYDLQGRRAAEAQGGGAPEAACSSAAAACAERAAREGESAEERDGRRLLALPFSNGHDDIGYICFGRPADGGGADFAEQSRTIKRILDGVAFNTYKTFVSNRMHLESMGQSYRDLEAKSLELEEKNKRLRGLDQLKTNFVSTVSHELRTPLTTIIGFSELMLGDGDSSLNEDQRTNLALILEKGRHLLRMVNAIINFSCLETGDFVLDIDRRDIIPLAREALEEMREMADSRGVALETAFPECGPPCLVDDRRLKEILVYLLDNAVKFSKKGGAVLVSIAFDSAENGGEYDEFLALSHSSRPMATVSVRDRGIGIPAEDFEAIFEKFHQLDSSITRAFEGLGIGLPLARSLVRMQGGNLKVESEVGAGSVFSFTVPIAAGSAE